MAPTIVTPPPDQTAPTVHELIVDIAVLKDSPIAGERKQAEAIFEELLATYGHILMALAQRAVPYNGATVHLDPNDLYWKVALKIWERAETFNANGTDAEELRQQFSGWAAAILRNIVSDTIEPLKQELTSTESLKTGWDRFEEDVPEKSERARIAAEVLEEMDPKYAEVLYWTVTIKPTDGTQMRPCKEERDAICLELGVTQEGLRQRRTRAFKILEQGIKDQLCQ